MNQEIMLDYFGGYAPIQAEGKVGELNFYFRARWDTWRFEIGKPGVEVPARHNDALLFTRKGNYSPNDSHEEMAAVIINFFKQYLAETQNQNAANLLSNITKKLRSIYRKF